MSFDLNWLLSCNSRIHPKERILNKFKLSESGCWEYTGPKDRCGYGKFKIGGRNLGAHKVSYILHKGDFDQQSMEMMHLCHNRCCINPDHIKPGTHKENMNFLETKQRLGKSKMHELKFSMYGLKAQKDNQTLLFGSSYVAQKLGFSSGSISEACSGSRGRKSYRGFTWSYI